jgi:hypothetical protein
MAKSMTFPKPIEDPLRRMLLFLRSRLVVPEMRSIIGINASSFGFAGGFLRM